MDDTYFVPKALNLNEMATWGVLLSGDISERLLSKKKGEEMIFL